MTWVKLRKDWRLCRASSYNPFRRFTYVTAHSLTLPSLHLSHSPISNPSVAAPKSQLILQPLRHFTYVTAHSTILLSLYLRHSSLSYFSSLHLRHSSFHNPSVASTYVTAHSPTLPSLHLRHSSFHNPSVISRTSSGKPPMVQVWSSGNFSSQTLKGITSHFILDPEIRRTRDNNMYIIVAYKLNMKFSNE